MLDVSGEGLLALEIDPPGPPPTATGVIVAVPADLTLPPDVHGLFTVLSGYSTKSNESLHVVGYLP